jgi:hypothetical protein
MTFSFASSATSFTSSTFSATALRPPANHAEELPVLHPRDEPLHPGDDPIDLPHDPHPEGDEERHDERWFCLAASSVHRNADGSARNDGFVAPWYLSKYLPPELRGLGVEHVRYELVEQLVPHPRDLASDTGASLKNFTIRGNRRRASSVLLFPFHLSHELPSFTSALLA